MILADFLSQLNQLNETKGQELVVLSQLPEFRKQAETEQNWVMVVQSYWQEHLAHQHLVMSQKDPQNIHKTAMLTSALTAHKLITDHQLNELSGSSHRFLGRAYTYNGEHESAKTEYQNAIEIFKTSQDPRYLEVAGFLAESLVRTKEVEKGLNLAIEIYNSYDTDPLALALWQKDEYAFIVWRTGIFPRLLTALNEVGAEYDKTLIKTYLEKSKTLLTDPDKFSYRLDEINRSLSLL